MAVVTPLVGEPEKHILAVTTRYRQRAEAAQRRRKTLNAVNWHLFHMRQDFQHKREWQSRLVRPDFSVAVQHITQTLKRGVTDSDDWMTCEPVGLGAPLLDPDSVRYALLFYLDRLYVPGDRPESTRSFATVLSDALLHGILESIMTIKIYPVEVVRTRVRVQMAPSRTDGRKVLHEWAGKELVEDQDTMVRLAMDVLPFEQYLPDPAPAQRFDIHRVQRPIGELRGNPEYDPKVIEVLSAKAQKKYDEWMRTAQRSREATATAEGHDDPWEVTVDECWGDVIDEQTGAVLHHNVFWTVCDQLLLRPPTPNPFWHQRRPFVSIPLLRAPNAPTHPAMADRVVDIVQARNELDSLMLDGAYGEVWGTRQVRPDLLEDDSEIQDGIPPAYTAILKPRVPTGEKFLERVDATAIPQLALEMDRLLDVAFQTGLASPSSALGKFAPRQTKATEIVEVSQAADNLFEGVAATIEDDWVEPTLELAWMTILQFVDRFDESELIQVLGAERVLRLQQLRAPERFELLRDVKFRCRGLRGVAAKQRQFTKMQTVLGTIEASPAMVELFDRVIDLPKYLIDFIGSGGVDVAKYARPPTQGPLDGSPHLDATLLTAPGGGSAPAEATAAGAQAAGTEAGFASPTRLGVPRG
jgi:hypothetical protein